MAEALSNEGLVELVRLKAGGYLDRRARDERVLDAMRLVDRAAFLPASSRWAAYLDQASDIGFGQTCSQPSMVAFMLELLELKEGLEVLEIGAGSGYAAALLALLCRPGGSVLSAEILPELARTARANCALALARLGSAFDCLELIEADGSAGLSGRGPFDRILLSAGVGSQGFREAPLVEQLRDGGILVYPQVRGRLFRLRRRGAVLERESWTGVAFVRLLGRNS